jgi:hypothetical protein
MQHIIQSMVASLHRGVHTSDVYGWAEEGGLQHLNVFLAVSLVLLTATHSEE